MLKKISGYIQEQNEKIYAPRGLLLTDPIERGMRVVSFTLHAVVTNRKNVKGCARQYRTDTKGLLLMDKELRGNE